MHFKCSQTFLKCRTNDGTLCPTLRHGLEDMFVTLHHTSHPTWCSVCRALLQKRTSNTVAVKSEKPPPQKKARLQAEGKQEASISEDRTAEGVIHGECLLGLML